MGNIVNSFTNNQMKIIKFFSTFNVNYLAKPSIGSHYGSEKTTDRYWLVPKLELVVGFFGSVYRLEFVF